jgi:hypothetical protein
MERRRGLWFQASQGKKSFREPISTEKSWARWHQWLMPIIPVTQEAEIRRIPAGANNSWDPVLKILITKIGLAESLKWESTCIASMRPWVQTPIPPKRKRKGKKKKTRCGDACSNPSDSKKLKTGGWIEVQAGLGKSISRITRTKDSWQHV